MSKLKRPKNGGIPLTTLSKAIAKSFRKEDLAVLSELFRAHTKHVPTLFRELRNNELTLSPHRKAALAVTIAHRTAEHDKKRFSDLLIELNKINDIPGNVMTNEKIIKLIYELLIKQKDNGKSSRV